MRTRRAAVAMVLACCPALGGCAWNAATSKDFLRVGQPPVTAINDPNPFVATMPNPFYLVYPQLVQYDERERIVPEFARRWSHSRDGRVWTFHTVARARWSDGRPLTADDVAWTIDTLVKYRHGGAALPAAIAVAGVVGATAPDATTVRITYRRPSALVLSSLTQLFILPRHTWQRYARGPNGIGLTRFANQPPFVSGGPFIWTTFKKGTFASFERNPRYWGPRPRLKGFGIQIFTDEDAMITALKSNEVDAVDYVSPANAGEVRTPDVRTESAPGLSVDYLAVNSNVKRAKDPELHDPRVRHAIDLAIDRRQIVKLVYGGLAQPGSSILPDSDGTWHDRSIRPTPFNPAAANAILDRLGYRRGPGGIRRTHGHRMSYRVVFPPYLQGAGTRELAIIQQGLSQIGVRVEPLNVSGAAANDASFGPDNKYLNMDMSMGNWIPYVDPDFLLSTYACSTWGEWNPSGYCSKRFDRAYVAQGRILDVARRRLAVDRLQRTADRLYAQDALVYPSWTFAHRSDWTGFPRGPLGWFGTSADSMREIGRR